MTNSTRSRASSRRSSPRFCKTLRDNGFAVGPARRPRRGGADGGGLCRKPGLLRSAFKHLFSARKSDWEKFDGLFDAFWLGKRVRSRSVTTGSAKAANSPSLKSLRDNKSEPAGSEAATDQVPSADEAPRGPSRRRPHGRRLARRQSCRDRFPQDGRSRRRSSEAHAVAARLARDHAHAADPPRPGAAARLPARPAPHHPRQYQPWRRADQPGQAAAQAKSRCGSSCCSTPPAR